MVESLLVIFLVLASIAYLLRTILWKLKHIDDNDKAPGCICRRCAKAPASSKDSEPPPGSVEK